MWLSDRLALAFAAGQETNPRLSIRLVWRLVLAATVGRPVIALAQHPLSFADSGYAVWSIEYRRVGDEGGGWPGTFADVAQAADHLRVLAGRYELDLERLIAAGHSAGANFALWLAVRDRLRRESPFWAERPLRIPAVLALAPVADLEALHAQGVCGNVMDKLMGGPPEQVGERYRQVSPALMLPIGVPQRLLVGGMDRSWGPRGRAYHAQVVGARDTLARLVELPASGHFDMVAPTTTSWPLVMDALGELSRLNRGVP